MVSPGWVNLGIHGSYGQMLPLELDLLFNVSILELMVVFLEANLDLVKAHIQVPISLLELSAPDGEVVLKSFHQPLTFCEVMPWVLSIDETATMQSLHNPLTIFLPAGSLVKIPREVQRQLRSIIAKGRNSFPDDTR